MKLLRKNSDWDDPQTTIDSKEIIRNKELLLYFYDQNYSFFKKEIETIPDGTIVELGSGAGYIKEVIPHCITSDVLDLPFIDQKFSALEMPFADKSVAAICMIDVFHHIPDVEKFLHEAQRVLKVGGKILMVEPANTKWGRFIYQNFHHEPFLPETKEWKLPKGGPMSAANGALPWIVFQRDWKEKTTKLFPMFSLKQMDSIFPLLYLLSGGLSWPSLPFASLIIKIDQMVVTGMFYRIVVEKTI